MKDLLKRAQDDENHGVCRRFTEEELIVYKEAYVFQGCAARL